MRSTPTSEHARFLELDPTNYNAQSWLPNWSAGGLTLALELKMNTPIIDENIPNRAEYNENSLMAQITDNSYFDIMKYWEFEQELINISNKLPHQELIDIDLIIKINWIFKRLISSFSWHYNKNDTYEIKSLKSDQILEIQERIEYLFDGFLTGELPNNSIFDLQNPLL